MDTRTATLHICDQLRLIDGSTSPWNPEYNFWRAVEVREGHWFLDEINEFPTITVQPTEDEIVHSLSGERRSRVLYELRAYTYDEDVQLSGELIADDVEHVINSIRRSTSLFDDIRVEKIETDFGLLAPYGVAIITLLAVFTR